MDRGWLNIPLGRRIMICIMHHRLCVSNVTIYGGLLCWIPLHIVVVVVLGLLVLWLQLLLLPQWGVLMGLKSVLTDMLLHDWHVAVST